MQPLIFGVSTYFLTWLLAIVWGMPVAFRAARRAGFSARQSLIALALLSMAIFLGSKGLFIIEHALFPFDDPVPTGQGTLRDVLDHGFRIPGGVLLAALLLPVITRLVKLPTARFADAVSPAIGITVLCVRIGCFLNGCCFGGRTDTIFGVSFPAGSRVYQYQLLQNEIAWPAQYSLPVHPLQLYFACLGLLMYICGVHWQGTKRFEGEVWANLTILFFGGTLVLEFLRSTPLHLNLILCTLAIVITVGLVARARQALPRPAQAT